MDELPRKTLVERENVEIALSNLEDAMARNEKTVIELWLSSRDVQKRWFCRC